jgi:hypothetical protein
MNKNCPGQRSCRKKEKETKEPDAKQPAEETSQDSHDRGEWPFFGYQSERWPVG